MNWIMQDLYIDFIKYNQTVKEWAHWWLIDELRRQSLLNEEEETFLINLLKYIKENEE